MKTFNITGKFTKVDSKTIKGANISIELEKMDKNEVLFKTLTNNKGEFTCQFEYEEETLKLRVVAMIQGQTIAEKFFSAKAEETLHLHLIEGNAPLKQKPRIAELKEKITKHTDETKLPGLDDETIGKLSRLSGVPVQSLNILKRSVSFAGSHGLDKEVAYAFMDAGHEEDIVQLATIPENKFMDIINQAVEGNRISEDYSSPEKQTDIRSKFRKAAVKQILEDEHDQTADIRRLANHIAFGPEQKKAFAGILLDTPFLSMEFIDKVQGNSLFNEKVVGRINRIRLVSELSDMHESTMNAFKKKVKSENEYSPLFSLTRNAWRTLVKNEIKDIPEHITGDTEEERIAKYASELYLNVEQRFPGELMNFKVSRSKTLIGETGKDVKSILSKSKELGFDLAKTEINTFFHKKEKDLTDLGLNEIGKANAKEELKSWQRLYKITPEGERYENTEVLRKAKLGAASEIVDQYTQNSFREKFGKAFGNETSDKIYSNAKAQLTNTLALAQIVRTDQMPKPNVLKVPQETKDKWKEDKEITDFQIPDFASLFGSQSYCSCKHCRSVLSPAAYLVDLLEFLRKASSGKKSAYTQLLKQRPDILKIKLNCQNTNTSMPYIDLVIEVLEQAVMNDIAFEHQTTWKTEELKAMPEHMNSNSYGKLMRSVFPFILPFHLWNEEGNYILDKWGYKRHELLREFNAVLDSKIVSDEEIAFVHLNISTEELKTIAGAAKTKVYWGFESSDLEDVFKDSCKVNAFLNRSELSYSELSQLIQIPALNFDDALYIYFEDDATCDLESAEFKFKKSKIKLSDSVHLLDFFDRSHRIIRLRRKTGLSFIELGMILKAFEVDIPNEAFLIDLSNLLFLKDKFNLELEEALSWFTTINTFKDKNDSDARSLYERLFLNNSIDNPASSDFEIDSDFNDLKGKGNNIVDYKSFICSALEIDDEEYQLLITNTGIVNLGINELTILYRYVSFSRSLQISIEGFTRLLSIFEFKPFSLDALGAISSNLTETVTVLAFIDRVEKIQKSNFSVFEFIYILTLEDLNGELSLTENKTDNVKTLLAGVPDNLTQDEINAQIIAILSNEFNLTETAVNQLLSDLVPSWESLNSIEFNYEELHQASIIIEKLQLNDEDLTWYYKNKSNTLLKWLGFHQFSDDTEPIGDRVKPFMTTLDFAELCHKFGTEDIPSTVLLDTMLDRSTNEDERKELLADKLATITSWSKEDIISLFDRSKIDISVAELANGSGILAIEKVMDLLTHCGVTLSELESWLEIDLDEQPALSLRSSLRARYSEQQWYTVGAEIRNQLRQKQRDALSAYLIQKREKIEDAHDLFDRYLLDTEMEPCMLTSRIKQAISSVQLFIHQAMMGLARTDDNQQVKLFDEDTEEEYRELWEWMKNYRVWEANRKVFLYPENYLLPELRLSKSELFEQLENDLAKNELDEDYVKDTFIKYLEWLENISNLTIVTHCTQETNGNEYLHVFGRTPAEPYEYYHRILDKSLDRWSPWKKIESDVNSIQLSSVSINGRVLLFRMELVEKTMNGEDFAEEYWGQYFKEDSYGKKQFLMDEVDNRKQQFIFYEVRFYLSEYKNKSWQTSLLKGSEFDTSNELSVLKYIYLKEIFKSERYILTTEVDADSVTLRVIQRTVSKNISYEKIENIMTEEQYWDKYWDFGQRHLTATLHLNYVAAEQIKDDWDLFKANYERDGNVYIRYSEKETKKTFNEYDLIGEFQYSLGSKQLTTIGTSISQLHYYLPENTITKGNIIEEKSKSDTLKLPSGAAISINGLTINTYSEITILNKTPGRYQIPLNNPQHLFHGMYHFFYNGSQQKFYVKISDSGKMTKLSKIDQQGIRSDITFRFINSYHPYIQNMVENIMETNELTDALSRKMQLEKSDNFKNRYDPTRYVQESYYPIKDFDFSFNASYSLYNWEAFFHIPLLIATKLSNDNKFEESQKWLHYIFDPRVSKGDAPQRYWQLKPFYQMQETDSITELLYALSMSSIDTNYATKAAEVTAQIEYWKDNPFDPHAVAEMRITSYMMSTVFAYIDNLVRWGDYLFQQDTLETINEATNLYILAARLLGRRPEEILKDKETSEDLEKTYEELSESGFDAFSNSLIKELESFSISKGIRSGNRAIEKLVSYTGQIYFCVPGNDKMLGYWDTVGDRLFKIRNCQNIDGQFRMLPLFEPPIDPLLLIRARAMGLSISEVLDSFLDDVPRYRFSYYLQKAMQYTSDLQSLGGALLSALEKKDAEELALLRAGHEKAMLTVSKDMKKLQLKEAEEGLEGIRKQREVTMERYDYYKKIKRISSLEKEHIKISSDIEKVQLVSQSFRAVASLMAMIPDFEVGLNGPVPKSSVTFGGTFLAEYFNSRAELSSLYASVLGIKASKVNTNSNYERRWDDWKLQERLAKKELTQIEKQILAAEIRVDIARKDIENLELQMEQQQETFEFMSGKYTNKELYDWMGSQIATVFYCSYDLAKKLALKAQSAYNFELGLTGVSIEQFIRQDNWDSLKKGLLCGEKLSYDLKRMEVSYMENNTHDYELTKHISLAMLDPIALIHLRNSDNCEFEIPEVLFDLDHPGHYFRRIKSVSISMPCIAGPYTSVSSKLSLQSSSIRMKADLSEPQTSGNTNISSIATSNSQNDAGVFELNFRDERYQPFEGAGAIISKWKLELPSEIKQFDYKSISDVILHIKYTSREGGDSFKSEINKTLSDQLDLIKQGLNETGLHVAINLKHDMPNEWHLLKSNGRIDLTLDKSRLPYMVQVIGTTVVESLMFISKIEVNEKEFIIEVDGNLFKPLWVEESKLWTGTNLDIKPELGKPFNLSISDNDKLKLEELLLVVKYRF